VANSDPLIDLAQVRHERAEIEATLRARPSGSGGGRTTDDELQIRVKRLEDDAKEMKEDLKTIRTDLAYVRGKIDSLPTTMQLIAFAIAVFVAAGIARYFGH
jgi:hypothetical protein